MRFKSMIAVVRRTGHSSWYVEKGMNAMGKTQRQLGIQTDYKISGGGGYYALEHASTFVLTLCIAAFPIWLEVRLANVDRVARGCG